MFYISFTSIKRKMCHVGRHRKRHLTLNIIFPCPPVLDLTQKHFSFSARLFITNGGAFDQSDQNAAPLLAARAPSSVWSTAFLTACQGCLEITKRTPLSDARISPPAFPTRALRLTLSLFRGFRKRRTKTPPPGTGMEPQPDQPSRYVFKVPGSQKHQKMDTSVLVTASLRLEPIA